LEESGTKHKQLIYLNSMLFLNKHKKSVFFSDAQLIKLDSRDFSLRVANDFSVSHETNYSFYFNNNRAEVKFDCKKGHVDVN
jgi:hypothetical protein